MTYNNTLGCHLWRWDYFSSALVWMW